MGSPPLLKELIDGPGGPVMEYWDLDWTTCIAMAATSTLLSHNDQFWLEMYTTTYYSI